MRIRTGLTLGLLAALSAAGCDAAGIATATANGFGVGGGSGSLPPATAEAAGQAIAATQSEHGELGYGDATTVTGKLGGKVTALPAAGSTVTRGQALYRVDNAPVVLLYGSLPASRALSPGMQGADVKQFEQNLYELGYRGFAVDEQFSGETAGAVKAWQDDLGLPQTGTVESGRVAYAAGPMRVDSHEAAVGEAAKPGMALLTCTGTSRVVHVELDMSDQRLARDGATVSITLPDGKTVAGKITETRTVTNSGSEGPEIQVTIALEDEKALAGLGQAPVQVGFTAA